MPVPNISIAIPFHGNRWHCVRKNLLVLANDPRVAEFVIVDDHSSLEDYKTLTDGVEEMREEVGFPIRVHRNDANLFIFRNKRKAVELASSEWVCLLDSDNYIDGTYIDAWERALVPDPSVVYIPEFARPGFDFTRYSGRTFTAANITSYMDGLLFESLLNTGNYILNRLAFLDAMKLCEDGLEPLISDVIYANYILLKSGGKLLVVPGMQYDHPIHDGSSWKLHSHRAVEVTKHILDLYARLGS